MSSQRSVRFATLTIGLAAAAASAQKIYWTESKSDGSYSHARIQRADSDGSNVEVLLKMRICQPFGIAVDHTAGKVYWTNRGGDRIMRSNLDGSEVQACVVAESGTYPGGARSRSNRGEDVLG